MFSIIHVLTNLWCSLAECSGSNGGKAGQDMSLFTVAVTGRSTVLYTEEHLSHAMDYNLLRFPSQPRRTSSSEHGRAFQQSFLRATGKKTYISHI